MINKQKIETTYNKIKGTLKGKEGNIVAIDPESGDYFVGKDILEAYNKGIKKHPGKEFFFKRIGAKHTFTVGAM